MNKLMLTSLLVLSAFQLQARKAVIAGKGSTTTAPGIGGYAQIGYAFAKGDGVTIDASASKQLERMIVMVYPQNEIGRVLATKTPHYQFTMPQAGIIVIRFISDRGGTNKIDYTVTRMPASNAVQRYNTKVVWMKPPPGVAGDLVPKRAGR